MQTCMRSLGDTYSVLGQSEKAIEFTDKAIRLSPHDPALFFWYTTKSGAYFALQQYDQAIEWARRSIAINPNYTNAYSVLASALARAVMRQRPVTSGNVCMT